MAKLDKEQQLAKNAKIKQSLKETKDTCCLHE